MNLISGIQQMGIGIPNVHEAWKWYRTHFGMDVPIFEEAATAGLMLPYTGGKPHDRHAVLALSMQGGGGFEIWQYTSRTPQAASFDIRLGDLGINVCKMKSTDVDASFAFHQSQGITVSTQVNKGPKGQKNYFVQDPYGNLFQIVEASNTFTKTPHTNGGVYGAIMGVSDIDKSLNLYRVVLGYDELVYDVTAVMGCFESVSGGDHKFRRVLLRHSKPRTGAFSELLGPTEIELIQDLTESGRKIYENRYWGDLGFIHLCFDVNDMKALEQVCNSHGFKFTVDSANSFDMGEAAGHFTYIEDADGALIEFVETHKIPVLKKLNWYVDLRKRSKTALPKWMLRALALNRKKD